MIGRKVHEKTNDEGDKQMTSESAPLHLAEQFRCFAAGNRRHSETV